jgi:ribosome-binding protein aMBF1 (putative translation factor)
MVSNFHATNVLPRSCWMCGRTIRLDDCKIDEHGMAVHEDCYVSRVMMKGNSPSQFDGET